jgi:phosphoribosylformylglycinamidine synthase
VNKSTRLIYVEKQKPFNVAAQNLLHELQTNLHIKGIKNIRILIKYVITGIDDQTFAASLQTIFSEPPVDAIFLEKFNLAPHTNAFAVAFLPEQFDQRADSAEQCLKLINPSSRPQVNTAHVYILEGKLSNEEINEVKRYLINPVDSHEVSVYVKKIKSSNILNVSSISTLKQFNAYSIDDLKYFHQQEKLAISLEDLILIQKFFIKEQRAPTITEIKVIDTY